MVVFVDILFKSVAIIGKCLHILFRNAITDKKNVKTFPDAIDIFFESVNILQKYVNTFVFYIDLFLKYAQRILQGVNTFLKSVDIPKKSVDIPKKSVYIYKKSVFGFSECLRILLQAVNVARQKPLKQGYKRAKRIFGVYRKMAHSYPLPPVNTPDICNR